MQAKPCITNCVQATEVTGGINRDRYSPWRVHGVHARAGHHQCLPGAPDREAEACKFVDQGQKGRWLVFKIDQFTSIETSKDESYSIISVVTLAGRPFSFKAIWWTDDKRNLGVNSRPPSNGTWTRARRRNATVLTSFPGQAVGEADTIVLKSIDTCAPKAPNFGVPEGNVFK